MLIVINRTLLFTGEACQEGCAEQASFPSASQSFCFQLCWPYMKFQSCRTKLWIICTWAVLLMRPGYFLCRGDPSKVWRGWKDPSSQLLYVVHAVWVGTYGCLDVLMLLRNRTISSSWAEAEKEESWAGLGRSLDPWSLYLYKWSLCSLPVNWV